MSIDVQAAVAAAVAQAAKEGPNMNEAQKGGGTYVPPAAGPCLVTLVGYVELGVQHVEASKHDPVKFPAKDEEQVSLIFEVGGKGHEPKEVDGKLYPERMTVTLKKSLNEKAWYYKIFKALNYAGTATHFAQLVGKHFLATIYHTGKDPKKQYAGFKNESGYSFRAPVYNPDPMDLTITAQFPAPAVLSEQRVFLWDYPSKPMWDSLFIDGEYPEQKDEKTGVVTRPAKSKNVLQNTIRSAVNFNGSPLAELISGDVLELPDTDVAAAAVAAVEAEEAPAAADAQAAALAALL